MKLEEAKVGIKFRFAGRVYKRLNDTNASCINDAGFTLMLNLTDEVELLDVNEPTNINPVVDPVSFYEEECCGSPDTCLGPTGDVVEVVEGVEDNSEEDLSEKMDLKKSKSSYAVPVKVKEEENV